MPEPTQSTDNSKKITSTQHLQTYGVGRGADRRMVDAA